MPDRAPFDSSRIVTVRVPATSANLGPGFDALGMALTLYNTFTFRFSEDDRHHITLPDTETLSTTDADDNLILKAAWITAMQEIGNCPYLTVYSDAIIPSQRGLGSSASAVIAGILGVSALINSQPEPERILRTAAMLEGHADNATAALYGGVQCALVLDNGLVVHHPVPIAADLQKDLVVVACVPALRMGTEASRDVLPATVSREDAAYSIGRAALQMLAWTTGNTELFADALEDRLHQPYRLPLIPGAEEAFAFVQQFGVYGSCLSGSGSTLISLCPDEAIAQKVAQAMEETLRIHKTPVEAVHLLRLDTAGATVSVV